MLLLLLSYFGGVLTHSQPLHPAGAAIRVRALRSTLSQEWFATACRYGDHVCPGRQPRDRRRGLGGKGRRVRRIAALILFAVFGLTLLFSSLADRLSRPLVQLGNRLSRNSNSGASVLNSLLLGIGTGLLWAPCAGPIFGLILTGAAPEGATRIPPSSFSAMRQERQLRWRSRRWPAAVCLRP